MNPALDILAFAPHPDDAELGCGGTLALAAGNGLQVAIADLTEGEMSSRGTPEERQREKNAASEILGLAARYSVELPDTRLSDDNSSQAAVIALIRRLRPRVVLAPYWEDRHPDHARAGMLIRSAAFLAGVRTVASGEAYRPTRIFYYMMHHPFTPSLVVDISSGWNQKIAAIEAYQSQVGQTGPGFQTALTRPNFLRLIQAKAVYFGAMVGALYGEPFFTPGPVSSYDASLLVGANQTPGDVPYYSMY